MWGEGGGQARQQQELKEETPGEVTHLETKLAQDAIDVRLLVARGNTLDPGVEQQRLRTRARASN